MINNINITMCSYWKKEKIDEFNILIDLNYNSIFFFFVIEKLIHFLKVKFQNNIKIYY